MLTEKVGRKEECDIVDREPECVRVDCEEVSREQENISGDVQEIVRKGRNHGSREENEYPC